MRNVSSKAADEPDLVEDQVRKLQMSLTWSQTKWEMSVAKLQMSTIKSQHPPAIIPYLIPITGLGFWFLEARASL